MARHDVSSLRRHATTSICVPDLRERPFRHIQPFLGRKRLIHPKPANRRKDISHSHRRSICAGDQTCTDRNANKAKFWPAGVVSSHCNGVGDGSKATSPTPTVSPKAINPEAVDFDEAMERYEEKVASDELGQIEELEERVKEAELGLERQGEDAVVVRNVETPTKEDVEAHEASGHPNFKRWCPACPKGFAQRYARRSKSDKRKRTSLGEIKVP